MVPWAALVALAGFSNVWGLAGLDWLWQGDQDDSALLQLSHSLQLAGLGVFS